MNTILRRSGERPAMPVTPHRARRLLSRMLRVTLDRMTLPYRDLPTEFYHFPPF